MYCTLSTIVGALEGFAQPASKLAATSAATERRCHPWRDRAVTPASIVSQGCLKVTILLLEMLGLGLGLGGPGIQGFDRTLVEGFIGLV